MAAEVESLGRLGPPASERALHIAARIWCDQDMLKVAMDADAAERIARIIDEVIERNTVS